MDYGRPALADRLAAEYVSGLLRGPARRRFESLLPAHATLRRAEREWRDRLMPLTEVVEPREPSPAVWPRIEQRLRELGGAAPAPHRSSGVWGRLGFWRGLSATAGVAALALAVLLARPVPVRPPIVVVLAAAPTPGAAPGAVTPASFVASISADGRAMVTKPLVNVRMEPGRSLELWSLPPSGAPRSLGVIDAERATVVERGPILDGTAGFAVTLEPAGGSPSGKPTGPVLYSGKLTL